MLWLGLHLPLLPLEVFERQGGSPSAGGPRLAVCDARQVLLANRSARDAGVRAGQKRATALALAPDLLIRERQAAGEHDALTQVASWALQFTPSVSLTEGGLLMEVEPSLRMFGGLPQLLQRLRGGLAELGFVTRIAHAPTATGAWLLARHQDGSGAGDEAGLAARLAGLPVWLLQGAQPHLPALQAIGLTTVRDLTALPRAGLARRFGKELLNELDRAFGRQPDPRAWFEAPAEFHVRLELLAQVEQAEALLFAARRLLQQLTGWLAARGRAASAFELRAEHDERPATSLSLHTAEPTRDAGRLTGLLREKLAVTTLPAPVLALSLHNTVSVALADANSELFPVPASAGESLGRLIERLQARLGREQVQRLRLAEDHRPEAAYRIERIDAVEPLPPRMAQPLTSGALPRPLWLLQSPVALDERNSQPWWRGPLSLLAGPERIESGWWDGGLVQRDYFVAEDAHHVLYWIFRERLSAAGSRQGWYLQGRFG
ncbi:MAG TPA: DNA polymerase Y family protein [Burkholderiaceae bacterium]|nr:DNA polymerase Y family protein [Burkholderiaceae bacterium]